MKWNILNQIQDARFKTQDANSVIIPILLGNRGLKTKKQQEEFLHPSLKQLERDFFDKKQLKKAIERIKKALEQKEQIVVYSDYDVDGITGTAILWETLHSLQAKVMPFVPDRFKHGYGLSKKGIADILKSYPETKLIITVDNGITASDEVALLKEKGIDVIITDHHTIPKNVPRALAIIHTTELSGSGVAYVFSKEVTKRHPEPASPAGRLDLGSNRFRIKSGMTNDDHLALAAIGTIADLVPLVGVNRVIAKFGLEALNKTKRIGLRALLTICGLDLGTIDAYHIGFVIAPRINASGRLSQGLKALQLLCTKDTRRAMRLADHLNTLNIQRQDMMREAFEHAQSMVSGDSHLLFVAHESYHEGIIGLVAGNLVDRFYRPAVVVSIGKEFSKASARSIRGVNIHTLLQKAAGEFANFGGHPMAAGFSIATNKLEEIEKRLYAIFSKEIDEKVFSRELTIDCTLHFSNITPNLMEQIKYLKPFGTGNHEPVFVSKQVTVTDARLVGREANHMKITVKQGNVSREGIGFNLAQSVPLPKPGDKVALAYAVIENEWNGKTTLQLKVKDIHTPTSLQVV